MSTVADIIGRFRSAEHFAAAIGAKHASYGRVIKLRGRIPERYWPQIIKATEGFESPVTEGDLLAAHASKATVAA